MNISLDIIALVISFVLVCAAIAWLLGTPDAPEPRSEEARPEAATYRPGPANRRQPRR